MRRQFMSDVTNGVMSVTSSDEMGPFRALSDYAISPARERSM